MVSDLVGLHLGEALDLLRGRPFDFDDIYDLGFAQAEVESQVALRHHAGAAVDFIHLSMLAGHNAYTRADGGAIALRADQFDLDPVLLVAAVVAKQ